MNRQINRQNHLSSPKITKAQVFSMHTYREGGWGVKNLVSERASNLSHLRWGKRNLVFQGEQAIYPTQGEDKTPQMVGAPCFQIPYSIKH